MGIHLPDPIQADFRLVQLVRLLFGQDGPSQCGQGKKGLPRSDLGNPEQHRLIQVSPNPSSTSQMKVINHCQQLTVTNNN